MGLRAIGKALRVVIWAKIDLESAVDIAQTAGRQENATSRVRSSIHRSLQTAEIDISRSIDANPKVRCAYKPIAAQDFCWSWANIDRDATRNQISLEGRGITP